MDSSFVVRTSFRNRSERVKISHYYLHILYTWNGNKLRADRCTNLFLHLLFFDMAEKFWYFFYGFLEFLERKRIGNYKKIVHYFKLERTKGQIWKIFEDIIEFASHFLFDIWASEPSTNKRNGMLLDTLCRHIIWLADR